VHERQAAATRQTLFSERGDRDDLVPLLHEEIDRLPERYRVPVVLCDLQGLTHEKAARHLGWPVGTVKSRLARARELLRDRLSRRVPGLLAGLLIAEKALGGALRAVEVVVPGTLVESTIRAAAPFAAGKALAVEVVSTRVAILIEEVLKTMFLTKLKLAAGVVLLIGAAGAAGVLAQSGAGSAGSPSANNPQGPAAAKSRPAPEVDSAPAPAPAYITQSRAMIITRLAEEVAEARARLDRTFRKVRSPEDPAVVHARKTLDDLQQRLDRIDRVLVDVVETYPTMFDFSGESPIEADLARAKDRAEWAKRMFDKGYVSKWQADAELTKYETLKARSEAGQPQRSRQQGGERSGKPGSQQGRDEQSPDRGEAGPKRQGDQQQGKSPGRGQKDSPKDDQIPDGGKAGQGQKDNPKDDQSPDEEKGGPKQQADPQLEKSPD